MISTQLPVTRPQARLDDVVDGTVSVTTSNTTEVIAAQSGLFVHLTDIWLANSSASFVTVQLLCGATVRATLPCPPTGGAIPHLSSVLKASASNAAWSIKASSGVSTVHATLIGFTSNT